MVRLLPLPEGLVARGEVSEELVQIDEARAGGARAVGQRSEGGGAGDLGVSDDGGNALLLRR